MKAKEYDRIRTLVEVREGFWRHRVFPAGTRGTIIECYSDPEEGYAVDLAVPDETSVTGFDYGNVILKPDQFEVVEIA